MPKVRRVSIAPMFTVTPSQPAPRRLHWHCTSFAGILFGGAHRLSQCRPRARGTVSYLSRRPLWVAVSSCDIKSAPAKSHNPP